MAADRRTPVATPVAKGTKPAVRKAPATAAALASSAGTAMVKAAVAPKAAAPKIAAPKAQVPKAQAPNAQAPKALAPKALDPKSLVPKSLVPKALTPKDAPSKVAPVRVPVERVPIAKPPKGDYALEEQVGFQLRRAHQRATAIFAEVIGHLDITPMQFAALAKIDDEGSISQNHLSRLTAMDPSTILGVVGRLARQGLVHLRSTPGDARLTMIELTLDGQKRVAEMKTLATEVSKRTLAPLTSADAKTLHELLARIG